MRTLADDEVASLDCEGTMAVRVILGMLRAAIVCCLLNVAASADEYASRTVNLIVPFTPGGSVDFVARLLAPKLSERLRQPVVVINVPGGSGAIATMRLINAAPDGYTLEVVTPRELSTIKLINPNVTFDAERDLAHIGLVARSPIVIVGGDTVRDARTLDDLIALARRRPGQLTYATSGVGSPQHLLGELLRVRTGADMVHVPFSGGAGGVLEVLGGHVDLSIVTLSSALEHIKAEKLHAFGIAEPQRSAFAPDIPALAEHQALRDVDMGIWYGLAAPAKTPPAIVALLNRYLGEALRDPQVIAKLNEQKIAVIGGSPADFEAYARHDADWYREIVATAHIKINSN
jgi:tripartite-type tricarboxylate transporter receptor subunit TctC